MNAHEYDNFQKQGKQAEARVGSVLRGGFVLNDDFFFVSSRRERVPVISVREIRFAPYT